jgi:hypothetical protein
MTGERGGAGINSERPNGKNGGGDSGLSNYNLNSMQRNGGANSYFTISENHA